MVAFLRLVFSQNWLQRRMRTLERYIAYGSIDMEGGVNSISILIVVDALGAVAADTLMGNVYLIDTNKFLGSWQEGTDTLHTVAEDGQVLNWHAMPVSPSTNVVITGFSGRMSDDGVCRPTEQGLSGDRFWQGRVETHGSVGSWTYTVTLSIDGKALSFSPFLKVV